MNIFSTPIYHLPSFYVVLSYSNNNVRKNQTKYSQQNVANKTTCFACLNLIIFFDTFWEKNSFIVMNDLIHNLSGYQTLYEKFIFTLNPVSWHNSKKDIKFQINNKLNAILCVFVARISKNQMKKSLEFSII